MIDGMVGGRSTRILVDTGCSRSVDVSWVISDFNARKGTVAGVDGHEVPSMGYTIVSIEVDGLIAEVDCVVMKILYQQER